MTIRRVCCEMSICLKNENKHTESKTKATKREGVVALSILISSIQVR